MKIYINNQLVKTEILPSNTPTLDETLETFSFGLISNTNPLPYAPMQLVRVDFTGDATDVAYFYIVSDSVETYSLNPLRYKHNISCVQNTRRLSKYLVRNSTFTQPADPIRKTLTATSGGPKRGINPTGHAIDMVSFTPSANWGYEKVTFADKERIKGNVKLKINFQCIKGYTNGLNTGPQGQKEAALYTNIHDLSEILAFDPDIHSLWTTPRIYLKYVLKSSSTIRTREITPQDLGLSTGADFRLNTEYDITDIIRLLETVGGSKIKEIWTEFQYSNFISGTWDQDFNNNYPSGEYYFHSYFCQLELNFETYYYTIYDILDLLIKRQKKQTSIRTLPQQFFLPSNGDLYDLLVSTVAPNFTFTQLTMYECVAEVFRVFDAIFTLDEDNVLGIEYFNDLSNESVPDTRFTGRTLSLGEDKYTNGLVVPYQDARVVESFPKAEGQFAHLRSEEFGVPQAQDHHFIVPHAIENIVKCEILADDWCLDITKDGGSFDCDVRHGDNLVLDITRYVVEQDLWSLLDVGNLNQGVISADVINNRKVVQYNSVYFVKGDNKIQVAYSAKSTWNLTVYALANLVLCEMMRKFGLQSPSNSLHAQIMESGNFSGLWYNVKMRLTYVASVNGKIETHSITSKFNGETLVDQANGTVDLNKLGLNTFGLGLKLGNPTLNATHRITTWAKRIKTGQIYQYQGKLWVANVVNYTFFKGMLQGKVSFVQNFNQLSIRTQLLREKRMTNISKELVQKSEEILTDFVYYFSDASKATNFSITGDEIHFNKNHLLNFIKYTFDVNLGASNPKHIGDVVAYTFETPGVDYVYTVDPYTNAPIYYGFYIPMVIYGAGNTVNFEMSFDHPMNAGNQTKNTSAWNGHQYFTNHTIYTDKSGFLEYICLRTPVNEIDYDLEFPKVGAWSDYDSGSRGDFYFRIQDFRIYKQPNEIFALNYQLAFLPYPGDEQIDFLGSEFINNNWFTNTSKEIKKTRYICFMAEKSSVLDTKVSSYLVKKQITSVTSSSFSSGSNYIHKFGIVLHYDSLTTTEKNKGPFGSWAIVDGEDNILFASNRSVSLEATDVAIYFLTKLNRLN